MKAFHSYKESHTDWTVYFLKFVETILTLLCMIYHIRAILYYENPIEHNVLFCATFGGFFILSLSGIIVPASGQLSPPGVDFIFSLFAFVLLFSSAAVAMYYIEIDKYLNDDSVTDIMEEKYPFFRNCKNQCVISLVTGTFYLMHAVISADRLRGIKLNLVEKERDPDLESFMEGVPEVDIEPNTTITLHLFFLDWILILWNTKCCTLLKNCLHSNCFQFRKDKKKKRKKKKKNMDPHVKAWERSRMSVNSLGESGLDIIKTYRAFKLRRSMEPENKNANEPPLKKIETLSNIYNESDSKQGNQPTAQSSSSKDHKKYSFKKFTTK